MVVEFEAEKLLLYTNTLFEPIQGDNLAREAEACEILVLTLEKASGEEEITLLQKILQSTKVEQSLFKTVILKNQEELLKQIHSHRPKKIIIFGMEPSPDLMTLASMLYVPFNFNGYEILISQSLRLMKNDPTAKKALWEALKIMLNFS